MKKVRYLHLALIHIFGSSSERRTDDVPGQQHLFDEAEVEQDLALLEEETVIRERTRKTKETWWYCWWRSIGMM